MAWDNLIKIFGLPNKQKSVIFLVILIVSFILLIIPNNLLEKLGFHVLVEFCANFKIWIILSFLFSLFFLLIGLVVEKSEYIKEKKIDPILVKHHLKHLREPENVILRKFINSDKQTQYLNESDEVVYDLMKKGIIEKSSFLKPTFNIKSWIFDYLKKHPKLLE